MGKGGEMEKGERKREVKWKTVEGRRRENGDGM